VLILAIRTDKPEAEIGLFADHAKLAYATWQAHRELAETIHIKVEELLESRQKRQQDVEGIVCFKGPGSFTGLRIGLTVANALAYALGVPIVAQSGSGWLQGGMHELLAGKNERIALPEYGAPVHITEPKH
jgi:tRNA threonylcarbamoyladenosine biosynthesis protein TsaB